MIITRLQESIKIKQAILESEEIRDAIQTAANVCVDAYKNNNKVLLCGNGGSAADAQHIAAELSGKFYYDRPPLDAEALHVNTSYMTAVANDYSYEEVYSRMVRARGHEGDVIIGISTSGNSPNIVKALKTAKDKGMITIGFSGKVGGRMADHCDILIPVPSEDTPRIQEVHIFIGHLICEIVEKELYPE